MTGKMTLTFNRDTYARLLANYQPKVIENDRENEQAKKLGDFFSCRFGYFRSWGKLYIMLQYIRFYYHHNYGRAVALSQLDGNR